MNVSLILCEVKSDLKFASEYSSFSASKTGSVASIPAEVRWDKGGD
jgi:hypothetical protein